MALPTSRNTTYAADDQILSADLNAIQDEIIANYGDDRHRESCCRSFGGQSPDIEGAVSMSSASFDHMVPLRVKPGATIAAVRARVYDNNGGKIGLELFRCVDGTPTSIGTVTTPGSGTQDIEIGSLSEAVPALDSGIDTVYMLEFTAAGGGGGPGAGSKSYSLEVEYE